jgi:hypothetical protein
MMLIVKRMSIFANFVAGGIRQIKKVEKQIVMRHYQNGLITIGAVIEREMMG